ncbi:MAG: ABC transporter permease [Clostridia bacterium]|nr:ABC transporter permease [Clostridia bacterium]
MIAIFKREFKSYFLNMSGYVFIGVIWLVSGIFSTMLNFLSQYASYEYVLSNLMIVLIFVVPILTMRSMAEDKIAKTDMLLYSLPVSTAQIVIGKYLAMLGVFGVACLGLGLTPIIIGMFGEVNFTSAYSALLGFYLLGAALIAVCTYVSSLTTNLLAAAVGGIVTVLGIYLISSIVGMLPTSAFVSLLCFMVVAVLLAAIVFYLTRNYILTGAVGALTLIPLIIAYAMNSEAFTSLFPKTVERLALFDRYYSFISGIFDVGAIVYYISFAVFFIFLTVQSFDKRRWS